MRFRAPLILLTLVATSFTLPYAAHAAPIPYFGPIIPGGTSATCAAGWGMVILVINNIIRVLLTVATLFVAPLMIAYAGFLFVVNPFNSGGIQKAKDILTNTVVGIVLALAGYLIVDALMGALYNGRAGAWASIINWNGDACLPQAGTEDGAHLNQVTAPTITTTGGGPIGRVPGPCATGNTACSPDAIQQAAQALNMNLTSGQIAALSCIAMTESSGNPGTPNSSTGACGTFQITNKTSRSNWQNPAYHQGSCSTSTSCNDAQCNLQTALIMYRQQGYQPWTGKNPDGSYWNANAVGCVQKYGT